MQSSNEKKEKREWAGVKLYSWLSPLSAVEEEM